MSRWIVTVVCAVLAAASTLGATDAWGDVIANPSVRAWSIAGFVTLRTAVLFAVSFCVFVRKPPRRHSRDPVAFVACAVALGSVVLLEKPSDTASTALVVTGDLVALAAWAWLLVSFATLGRCFGLLPEARGLVTRGPYSLVRHPVYLGEFGAVGGLLLASPTSWNLVLACAFVGAQTQRMRMEERALTDEFPEYADYAARTPRLMPRIGRVSIGRRLQRATLVLLSLVAAGLAASPAEAARLRAPTPLSPAGGAEVALLPAFAWSSVSGAERYEFQVAADAGFNSPVLGQGQGRFFTKNTRATLKKTLPNGVYWWRVRAARANGAVSPWSPGRSLRKSWRAAAALQSPPNGGYVTYPVEPLKLSWSAVPGAAKYEVSIATDPLLGSLVDGRTVETAATAFTRAPALPSGTYYWGITPLDAQGNKGAPSPVWSFVWFWPSVMTPRFADLASELEVVDPHFSWDAIPGGATYEVEVNSSRDFAPGSRVCCSTDVLGTSHSPLRVFRVNTYYWRVRAFDPDGNAGIWNEGQQFVKTFDTVPPVTPPSIKNMRMRDHLADPGTDMSPTDPGYQTEVPVLRWDPVPGAASYEVDVTPFDLGLGICNWSSNLRWQVKTAVPFWSPLGTGMTAHPPYGNPPIVARDFTALVLDQRYCARVRARSNRDSLNVEVYGDYTEVDNGDGTGWGFQWTGYPQGGSCTPSCNAGYLGADDYVVPARGSAVTQTPLLTWRPLAGRASYWVIVAKDPSFTNLVDYAFTQVPAYAPRTSSSATTYPDETTSYYWAVLPAVSFGGDGAVGNPLLGAPSSFDKRSTPPTRLGPQDGATLLGQPTFRWTLALGARRYRLQVSQDPTFGNPLDDVLTDATAHTSTTTYPADTVLYWRVRADDENLIGLTWSSTGTFQKRLPVPTPSSSNPIRGDFLPTWTWDPITGAVSYDVAVDLPDGTHRLLRGMRTPALTPILMYGLGLFHWRVRANFPKVPFGSVPGPYSAIVPFTRTIGEPGGARADASTRHMLLSWEPKAGVKNYQVQISRTPDFSRLVENIATDNTNYAPLLMHTAYATGQALYWRVAAVDEGRNIGDWSPHQRIGRINRLRLRARGAPRRNRVSTIRIIVLGADNRPVAGAAVRASGAGSRAARLRTNRRGVASFRVRATRRGFVSFRAAKSGYEPATLKQRVR